MFKGRRKNAAVVAGASLLVALSSLAIVPMAAGAQPTDVGTTTTVTATPASTTSGGAVTFVAQVQAVTTDATTITGTVTFTITGHNASTVNCHGSDTVTVSHGKATCKVPFEQLQAEASPYSIVGTYSGDLPNYTGSSGNASETVGQARTHMKLKLRPRVSNGSGNTFSAVLKSGKGRIADIGQCPVRGDVPVVLQDQVVGVRSDELVQRHRPPARGRQRKRGHGHMCPAHRLVQRGQAQQDGQAPVVLLRGHGRLPGQRELHFGPKDEAGDR